MLKAYTLKVDEKQLKILDQISKKTHIPKSALIRKGIELVIQQTGEDVITPELRQEVEAVLQEDRNVLKRLAE